MHPCPTPLRTTDLAAIAKHFGSEGPHHAIAILHRRSPYDTGNPADEAPFHMKQSVRRASLIVLLIEEPTPEELSEAFAEDRSEQLLVVVTDVDHLRQWNGFVGAWRTVHSILIAGTPA